MVSKADIEVELDLFAGRPNPTWKLPDDLARRLIREASQSEVIETVEMFEGLGYRGFLVHFDQAETWRVRGEILEITRAGSPTYKKNKSRSIERSLLESGMPYLDEKIFQKLERDIRASIK